MTTKANRTIGFKGFANAILRGCETIGDFRALSPMPPDAQRLLDTAVNRVQTERLVFVNDLITEGLTFDLPNWMSVPTIQSQKTGRGGHAQRTMVPKARGERQILDQVPVTIPVYATWDDFSFDIRTLMTAARAGYAIDTTHAEEATRNVNEAIEDQGINGAPFAVAGHAVPGLLNAPSLHSYQYLGGATGRAWDDPAKTGEHILADVVDMMDEAGADNYTGPFNLYVPRLYGSKLSLDYKSATSGTIRQRLEELEAGGRPLRIRTADKLPANRTALVQMTSNVVDVVVGEQPTMIDWEDGPGFEKFFIVMACVIVRFKSDYDGGSGVVVGNIT